MKQKQPFYRNKVAMLLRLLSYANLFMLLIVFLRGMYLYLILGWELGFKSTLYLVLGPIVITVIEMLRIKAVEYGTKLFNEKLADQKD